jgi:hypothetical protein
VSANPLTVVVAIAALFGLAPACAGNPSPSSSPAADKVEPPRMLTRGAFPELNISGPSPSRRPVARIHIEVVVHPTGRPDLKTLKVSGLGSPENRAAIERWIESATFRPAMRNGEALAGLYKTSIEVQVRVQRI